MCNRAKTVSKVLSNYNNSTLLKQTLLSVYRYSTGLAKEIIVIDDGSTDKSPYSIINEFPDVKLIRHNKNFGYSKSYNDGTRIAKGKYILHLNSDVVLINSTLKPMIAYLEAHKEIGIAGCKIIKLDGTLDLPCKRSFPTPCNVLFQTLGLHRMFPESKVFGSYYLTYLDENKIHEVDCLMGAFMMIRREVVKNIGLLDERFFIYGEDIDYCFRAKQAGWQIVYYPKITVRHHHGGTTNNSKIKHIYKFHKTMIQYYNKHYSLKKPYIFNILVYTGIWLRYTGMTIISLLKK